MTRVRVTIPATCANLGPGLDSMAIALARHNVVELSEVECGLQFDLRGEDADPSSDTPRNPVVQAALAVFRRLGYLPAGLRVYLENNIPLAGGLGSHAATVLGGVIAANSLLGSPLSREEMLQTAIEIEGRPAAILAAWLGGLVVSSYHGGNLVYAPVRVAPMLAVIVLPHMKSGIQAARLPQQVSLADATFNVGHAALVVQALQEGDFDLLARAMRDRLHEAARGAAIAGYEEMVLAAHRHGAAALAICGAGPALIAFAAAGHDEIASAMALAYHEVTQQEARAWVLPIDTQGISISEMGAVFGEERSRPIPASGHPVPRPTQTSVPDDSVTYPPAIWPKPQEQTP